jgi:endogenous inhibitor of DNA gyrase (YacG/DUF329 family)
MSANARQCPRCGKPDSAPWTPFCSGRCKSMDLGAWLTEVYRVRTDPDDGEEHRGSEETPQRASQDDENVN